MDTACRIILVDDDKDDQFIFKSAVSEINNTIACECFDNAEKTWKTLQTDQKLKPDAIFLDLNLPFMHGFEFLQLIKTSKSLNDIPVIIYSTSSRDSDKEKAKQLGASTFISKPNTFIELKSSITDLITEVCHCK